MGTEIMHKNEITSVRWPVFGHAFLCCWDMALLPNFSLSLSLCLILSLSASFSLSLSLSLALSLAPLISHSCSFSVLLSSLSRSYVLLAHCVRLIGVSMETVCTG